MIPVRSIRSRATALWRALTVLVVVAGAVTCDSPTSLGRRVSLSVAPVLGRLSLSGFSGMTVDSVRLTVVRPPSDTISTQTFPFSPDSASITANVTVSLNSSHEQLLVLIAFLSNSQVVFTGADTVDVVAGTTTPTPAQVPISYVGPGKSIAAIHITPRDSGVTFGSTAQFVVTATDSSSASVAQFYVSWSTGRAIDTINAAGLFRPASTRGVAWVRAHTPTGIWDSTRIAVVPVPSQIAIVSGDHQAATVSTQLPQQLVVQVKAADNLPVVGTPVQFAVSSGGGSVAPALVATDTAGKAATTITLGSTAGVNAFMATVMGAPSITVTSSDTATNLHGVPATIAKVAGDSQSVAAGTAVAVRPQVLVKDVFGAVVSGASVTFSVQTGGGSVTGGTVNTDVNGLAQVGSWTLGATPGANTLRASASVGTATPVTFTATGTASGIPASLVKVAGDTQTVRAGSAVAVAPAVKVLDAFSVRVAGASVQFAVTAGGGSTTGASVTSDTGGIARVGSWTLGTTAGANTLGASVPSVPAVTAVTFTATGKPFVTLAIVGSNVAGVGRAGLLAVKLSQADASSADTVAVTSDSSAYLIVTQPLVIFPAGDTTTHVVTDTGLAAGTAVVRATPVTIANPPRYLGTTLPVPVTTAAISLPPTFSVAAGSTAPLTVTLSTAAGAGGAVITLTSTDTTKAKFTTPTVTVPAASTSVNATVQGVAQGSATLVATNPNYAPAASSVTVTPPSSVASTVVSPHADTLTSLTDTFALTAQAKNSLGGNVAGTFTWLSRDTTKVKVGATGAVKAIANGSTYVVATETGGTKDSSLVLVQQRVSTVNVTPGTRNIYLTRNFTFNAAAVDGHGFAVPSATTFNWTTTAPAVASVDTSVHTAATIVTAAGLGTAQVKATFGVGLAAVTGVANVSVLTPITRIAVVMDTVNAFKTDTFTLLSLGVTHQYRAIAHDTVDAAMTGVTFTWASTNGSVAYDSTTGTATSTATSAANGVTTINATAQGFTSNPGAFLTVAQALASIELKPDTNNPTATIAPAGTMHVSARGKDANNRYISGGT
ncbi:MAG: beta strand repeat-containing protein, partial [Gemmatimonadales bacterium]